MFARILSLVTLAAVANAYWTFGGTPVLVQTRLDSIVNPDSIGTHVHAITGASGFSNHYDYDQLVQSNCTTITVQADKSNYWMPQMYHRDKDTGAFQAMPTEFNIYYLPRVGPKNESIKAFPKGFRSHVAYPIQAFNGGDCPDSHPVHLMSLFYEMGVAVNQFDFHGNGTWVLANGDTTGFGLHADFQNGWDVDLLQQAIDQCSGQSGNLADCAPLVAASDPAAAAACVFQGDLVDEPTGVNAPIPALPGCNPVFGSGQDTSSCANKPTPGLVSAQPPLPLGWTEIGCIAEGTSGRALPALTMSAPNMTKEACAAFCASHNFTLAGAEFSDECYCDNALKNGASGTLLPWTECANRCAGNSFEICGGGAKLTLMAHRASAHPARRASRFERERA
ncbi:WSC-domain-containing protein [Trametes sanguinea]|nr:WSC-domain-containing protein [Trametes sanguinea]